jgi:bacteriocin biosynthesis cyclodehydratase domain-containing protein
VLPAPGRVRLVAGEDFRYTLSGPGLETWLPGWLPLLDGQRTLEEALAHLPESVRESARALVARLAGERVLVDGPPVAAHTARRYRIVVEGTSAVGALLGTNPGDPALPGLPVLVQDRLDLEEALRFNERCLAGSVPFLWLTTGPLARGYVSPVFLPDAGPCLACLLGHFRRLSPFPELHDELIEHVRAGGSLVPAPFPDHGQGVLVQLARGKVEWLSLADRPAALYRLHVLELENLEVRSLPLFIDPDCPACRGRR